MRPIMCGAVAGLAATLALVLAPSAGAAPAGAPLPHPGNPGHVLYPAVVSLRAAAFGGLDAANHDWQVEGSNFDPGDPDYVVQIVDAGSGTSYDATDVLVNRQGRFVAYSGMRQVQVLGGTGYAPVNPLPCGTTVIAVVSQDGRRLGRSNRVSLARCPG